MVEAHIRSAVANDAAAIAEIYGHHVIHGTATFDITPPATSDWEAKIAEVLGRNWPFIIAEVSGRVVGYAYAAQFRDRPAYAGTCENSIYVAPDLVGHGVGASLMAELIGRASSCGFGQMIAVIGGAEPASVALHLKSGFTEAGRLRDVGLKFGKFLDTIYMQRDLLSC
jgi:phosphinothricin acetyltransferase